MLSEHYNSGNSRFLSSPEHNDPRKVIIVVIQIWHKSLIKAVQFSVEKELIGFIYGIKQQYMSLDVP